MSLNDIRDISILIAIWVAIYGIDSWRREFQGKRQIELAEEALALFYEAADAIAHIRNPFGFSNEFESVKREANESDTDFEARKRASVVFYRYNKHNELFSRIHSIRYRFMAAFGKDKTKPFDDLHKVVREIVIAARMLEVLWAQNYFPNDQSWQRHREQIKPHEEVFRYQGDSDAITARVKNIVEQMDSTCREIILGKGTLHYLINWKWRKDT